MRKTSPFLKKLVAIFELWENWDHYYLLQNENIKLKMKQTT